MVLSLPAQQVAEIEIRRLDTLEAQATLRGDMATLNQLWLPDSVVNNPANTIVDVAPT